jgi:CRP-like cAMP-binding protein
MKSRPVRRRELFVEAFRNLSEDYPGESRKVRRSMARDLSRRWYHTTGK